MRVIPFVLCVVGWGGGGRGGWLRTGCFGVAVLPILWDLKEALNRIAVLRQSTRGHDAQARCIYERGRGFKPPLPLLCLYPL